MFYYRLEVKNEVLKLIKNIRLKENISVNNLSKLSGVSNAYISKLENNKRKFPTIRTLFLLLVGFKIQN